MAEMEREDVLVECAVLLVLMVIGLILFVLFTNAQQFQTAGIALFYAFAAFFTIFAAFAAYKEFEFFDFKGISYSVVEQLKVTQTTWLLLPYAIFGFIIGFLITGKANLPFTRISTPGAIDPFSGFVFKQVLAPFVEELFIRSAVLATTQKFIGTFIDVQYVGPAVSFIIANSLQALVTALFHIFAFQGGLQNLAIEWVFAFVQGTFLQFTGALFPIFVHAGRNFAF
jgi:hypothetical protein